MHDSYRRRLQKKIRERAKLLKRGFDYTDTASVLAYFRIGSYGVKLYTYQRDRDWGYKFQKQGYKNGFGPRPYFRGRVAAIDEDGDKDWLYYYVTDHCIEYNKAGPLQKKRMRKQFPRLKTKLTKFGFSTGDYCYAYNTGLFRGKLVAIDFDSCTVEYDN